MSRRNPVVHPRGKSRRKLKFFALLAALSLVAFACGDGGEDEMLADEAAAAQAQAAAAQADAAAAQADAAAAQADAGAAAEALAQAQADLESAQASATEAMAGDEASQTALAEAEAALAEAKQMAEEAMAGDEASQTALAEAEAALAEAKQMAEEAMAEPAEAMGACDGATLSFIGLDGEAGETELEAWRAENGVSLETNWPGNWPQFVAAIQIGDVYDLATIAYHVGPRHIEAGLFQPIDTSRLENWDKMFPGLRENSSLRGADGQVYGVPIAWGDGPYIYHPGRVPNPPASITDLMEPEWEGRFTIFDSPTLVFSMLAVANGFDDGAGDRTHITADQLDVVKGQALQIVRNASAFAGGYRDATDVMVAGDSDLNVNGWEAMLTWAEEQGETLDFAFFEESGGGGWWDGLAIPVTADDTDCAYEYIDLMISDEINAQVGENLVSGVVNSNSADIAGPGAQIYDYDLVRTDTSSVSFRNSQPPEDGEGAEGITTNSDWLDAWEEIKAQA